MIARHSVGVQCFLVQDGHLLLGLRSGGFGAGTWGLPGGRLEEGETIMQAAARELVEETGIKLLLGEPIAMVEAERADDHVQVAVWVHRWAGRPRRVEPTKCLEWSYLPIRSLREPLFGPSLALLSVVGSLMYLSGNGNSWNTDRLEPNPVMPEVDLKGCRFSASHSTPRRKQKVVRRTRTSPEV